VDCERRRKRRSNVEREREGREEERDSRRIGMGVGGDEERSSSRVGRGDDTLGIAGEAGEVEVE